MTAWASTARPAPRPSGPGEGGSQRRARAQLQGQGLAQSAPPRGLWPLWGWARSTRAGREGRAGAALQRVPVSGHSCLEPGDPDSSQEGSCPRLPRPHHRGLLGPEAVAETPALQLEVLRLVLALDLSGGSPGRSVVKNPLANAGGTGDGGSIPGSGRSPEKEMTAHSSILAWRIPWTEEPGGLRSMGSQRVGHD